MRTRFERFRGRWRLFWGFCPECNSDAPELDTCPTCRGYRSIDPPCPMHPPPDFILKEWWQKFLNPPMPEGDIFFVSASDEPRWRSILRKALRAHWQHDDSPNPCDVVLRPGFYRRGEEPKVYREPGEGLTQVTPPVTAADAIISRTAVHVSWLDLLRVAFGCKIQVNLVIYCENIPGKIKTRLKVFAALD